MKPGIIYIWSKGLEEWEATALTHPEVCFRYPAHNVRVGVGKLIVEYQYSKVMGLGRLDVFKDNLDRFMGVFVVIG